MKPIDRVVASPTGRASGAAGWRGAVGLVSVALAAVTACGGASFSGPDAAGAGGGSGGSGTSGSSGKPGTSHGGEPSSAGDGGFGDAGESIMSVAGETGAAGAAGAANVFDCEALRGTEHGEHCYVDVTTQSVPQADAIAACSKLSGPSGRAGQLLVLDSVEEQTFILERFLEPFTDQSDAWLGLSCDATTYPDFTACYCANCDDAEHAEKRSVWRWVDGTAADFGWIGQNPDGAGRCSALAYNPSNFSWGWVDRNCIKTSHQLTGYPLHTYRVICELE